MLVAFSHGETRHGFPGEKKISDPRYMCSISDGFRNQKRLRQVLQQPIFFAPAPPQPGSASDQRSREQKKKIRRRGILSCCARRKSCTLRCRSSTSWHHGRRRRDLPKKHRRPGEKPPAKGGISSVHTEIPPSVLASKGMTGGTQAQIYRHIHMYICKYLFCSI